LEAFMYLLLIIALFSFSVGVEAAANHHTVGVLVILAIASILAVQFGYFTGLALLADES